MHARCSAGWIVRHATVAAPQATLYTLTVAESAREPASMNSRRSGGLALAACGETSELAIAVLHGGHQVTAADKPEVDTLDDPAPRGARLWVGLGHWDGAVRSRQCNASPTPPQKGVFLRCVLRAPLGRQTLAGPYSSRTPGKAQVWPRASEGTKRSPV